MNEIEAKRKELELRIKELEEATANYSEMKKNTLKYSNLIYELQLSRCSLLNFNLGVELGIKQGEKNKEKEFLKNIEGYRKYLARIQLKDPYFTIEGLYKLFNMKIEELKQSLEEKK